MIRSISESARGARQGQRSRQDPAWGVLKELDLCRKAGHQQSRARTEQAEERHVGGHAGPVGAQGQGATRITPTLTLSPVVVDARDPETGRLRSRPPRSPF